MWGVQRAEQSGWLGGLGWLWMLRCWARGLWGGMAPEASCRNMWEASPARWTMTTPALP